MVTLQDYLESWAGGSAERADIALTVAALAGATVELARVTALGPLADALDAPLRTNADGDAQQHLDVHAHELFLDALRQAPVAALASEECAEPCRLAVALDPLDGSSNIATNVPIGSIFGVLPAASGHASDAAAPFRQPGSLQLAAGFAIHGPRTALVLTVRQGADVFTLDPRTETFHLTQRGVRIPAGKREYAINASNHRHWDEPVRAYIDDCVAGAEGPHGADFNMCWIASLVAEAYRILVRGGVFLYPREPPVKHQGKSVFGPGSTSLPALLPTSRHGLALL